MELLGKSLEQLFEEKGSKLSLKTVCMLGIQMISRLEYIHNKHILHRDIKPDNFIIGIDINCHKVYLIDFGLSKKYRSSRTLQHIKYSENKKLIGTARYASINALAGIEQGRRDDMEALSYVLIYFLRGCLPWQGLRVNKKEDRYKKILEKKKMVNSKELCIGLPNQFYLFVDYCRQLKFDEEPNYEYLKGLLIEIMNNNNFGFDYVYDWSDKKSYNKDLSKSVYKESNNYLKRIQDKKSNEKEKNIENIENYANDRLKTIQEDYNNIDDINNEIGRININQFKFMSNLNKTSNYFGKKILIEENKNEEDKIESKNDGCYII